MALGAGVLRSPRKQKDAWVAAGMACDVADVGAGALAGIRGTLPPASAAMVTATAAFFALASAWLLQQLASRTKEGLRRICCRAPRKLWCGSW